MTNTPGANAQAVAELTIGLMFALARSLIQNVVDVRAGGWKPTTGIEIAGRSLGVVGLGRVGREVASRGLALGCQVYAYDPYIEGSKLEDARILLVDLDTLAASSDFVTLHPPLTAETRGMVNREFLGRVRNGAYLINTARGELVIEDDLLEALDSGRLSGAALDTLSEEPPPPLARYQPAPARDRHAAHRSSHGRSDEGHGSKRRA